MEPEITGPADIRAEDLEAIAPDPDIWERPLGDMGVPLDDAALDDLAYEPILPSEDVGALVGAYVSNAEMTGHEAQSLAWIFDSAAAGRFIVLEMPSGGTQADLEDPARQKPGCHTVEPTIEGADTQVACVPDDFSLVDFKDDVTALVVQNEHVTTVSWLEPMVVRGEAFTEFKNPTLEMRVMAPADGASLEQLVVIASSLT